MSSSTAVTESSDMVVSPRLSTATLQIRGRRRPGEPIAFMLKRSSVKRAFRTYLGVDLGGGKGKNTAVARLELAEDGTLEIVEVGTTHEGAPWYDEKLIEYMGLHASDAVLSVDAPLTLTACV